MEMVWTAIILGIVEGLTEFLPVSSTGHLILSEHLLGFTGEKAATFAVVIQLGAILAIVALYFNRFWALLVPRPEMRFSGIRGLWLLFLTCLPAGLLGLAVHDYIKDLLFHPLPVACALFVGALAILAVESFSRKRVKYEELDDVTPGFALGVGFFQCLSLWPGFSRSAATIMGGMILGGQRKMAAEYSFVTAVPIMFAATGYDLYKSWSFLSVEDVPFFAVGFVVSFISAWLAVKGFIHLLGKVTLRPFAWYRIVLALIVFFVLYQ